MSFAQCRHVDAQAARPRFWLGPTTNSSGGIARAIQSITSGGMSCPVAYGMRDMRCDGEARLESDHWRTGMRKRRGSVKAEAIEQCGDIAIGNTALHREQKPSYRLKIVRPSVRVRHSETLSILRFETEVENRRAPPCKICIGVYALLRAIEKGRSS